MTGAKTGGMVAIHVMLALIVFYSFLSLVDYVFAYILGLVGKGISLEDLLGKIRHLFKRLFYQGGYSI